MAHAKNGLPSHIKAELMKGSRLTDYGIYVEASKHDIVLRLDSLLGICVRTDFGKDHIVEIDRTGIPGYEYFFIDPKTVDYGRHVFFEMSQPTCSLGICPWGARITSPVRVGQRALKGLGIAYVSRPWKFRANELLVSRAVRDVFVSANVTGLEYEECWPNGGVDRSKIELAPAYLARIVEGSYQCSKDIIPGTNYCAEHSSVLAPYPFGLWTPREALAPDDFQNIDTLRVGSRVYYYNTPWWVISRRVLELLLANRVPGLQDATVFLNERFRPLLTDDRHWIH